MESGLWVNPSRGVLENLVTTKSSRGSLIWLKLENMVYEEMLQQLGMSHLEEESFWGMQLLPSVTYRENRTSLFSEVPRARTTAQTAVGTFWLDIRKKLSPCVVQLWDKPKDLEGDHHPWGDLQPNWRRPRSTWCRFEFNPAFAWRPLLAPSRLHLSVIVWWQTLITAFACPTYLILMSKAPMGP